MPIESQASNIFFLSARYVNPIIAIEVIAMADTAGIR